MRVQKIERSDREKRGSTLTLTIRPPRLVYSSSSRESCGGLLQTREGGMTDCSKGLTEYLE